MTFSHYSVLRDAELRFMQHALSGTTCSHHRRNNRLFGSPAPFAFTAHAFSEIGFAGAAGAVLLGLPPIAGFCWFWIGGFAIAALGRRAANRDTQIESS